MQSPSILEELESSVKQYSGMYFQLSTFNFIHSFTHIIYNILDSVHPRIEERNRGGGRDTNLKKGKEKSTSCAFFTFQGNILLIFFEHAKIKRNAGERKWSDFMGSKTDKIALAFQKFI